MLNTSELVKKRYWTGGEVAKALGVYPSLIRFWDKRFPQIKPKRSRRGVRLYTPADIATIKRICFLVKLEGYTLRGARRQLEKN